MRARPTSQENEEVILEDKDFLLIEALNNLTAAIRSNNGR